MFETLSDKIREEFISDDSSLESIYKLDVLDKNKKENIIRLFISDYYKICFLASIFAKNDTLMEQFDNIDLLVIKAMEDPIFLNQIIKCSRQFKHLSDISKINLFDIMEDSNKSSKLYEISSLSFIDKIKYSFKYDIETIKEYYVDFKKKDKLFKNENISVLVAKKFLLYKKNSYNEYKRTMLTFIREYYRWTIFVNKNFPKDYLNLDEEFYLRFIRDNSIDIILDTMENNLNFSSHVIDSYLYYSTCEKTISDRIVSEFFKINVEDEIKKKLI